MHKAIDRKGLLLGALGHLLCWLGGDLMLYFLPAGQLNVMGLFDYQQSAAMLAGTNPLQLTLSGVFGVIAMMLVMPGYGQLVALVAPAGEKYVRIMRVGTALTCVAGAVMHFTCTSMLWHFVMMGATEQAHSTMLTYFFQTGATSAMCNIGVLTVCITLLVAVRGGKTCLPRKLWWINTLIFTLAAGIVFAGMGAMNVGSCLMFLGLFFATEKYE